VLIAGGILKESDAGGGLWKTSSAAIGCEKGKHAHSSTLSKPHWRRSRNSLATLVHRIAVRRFQRTVTLRKSSACGFPRQARQTGTDFRLSLEPSARASPGRHRLRRRQRHCQNLMPCAPSPSNAHSGTELRRVRAHEVACRASAILMVNCRCLQQGARLG
jgi:hypothetical protein